jgi:hypothetical protein
VRPELEFRVQSRAARGSVGAELTRQQQRPLPEPGRATAQTSQCSAGGEVAWATRTDAHAPPSGTKQGLQTVLEGDVDDLNDDDALFGTQVRFNQFHS